jgi:hypothetical protein
MVKEQLIFENNKPIAVIIDYSEYKLLKEIAEDKILIAMADKAELESSGTKSLKKIEKELKIK